MTRRNQAWIVNVTGGAIVALAAFNFVMFQIVLLDGRPFNPIISLGDMLIAVIGIATSIIARAMERIEARLALLEADRPDGGSSPGHGESQPDGVVGD